MAKSTVQVEKEFSNERDVQLAQPKVKLRIPKDALNPEGVKYVLVNGVEYVLAVGTEIEVPECVAEVYYDSVERTFAAQEQMSQVVEIK